MAMVVVLWPCCCIVVCEYVSKYLLIKVWLAVASSHSRVPPFMPSVLGNASVQITVSSFPVLRHSLIPCLASFLQSLALLLQFVTGTSKVPLEGFKSLQGISGPQKFQIHKVRMRTHECTTRGRFSR